MHVEPHVRISRIIPSLAALASGVVGGLFGFVAVLLCDQDRGAINEVFGTVNGLGYVLPTVAFVLAITLLPTALLARHSATHAKLFGLSNVWVFSMLVVLAGILMELWKYVTLGSAIGIASTVVTVVVARSVSERAA